jgi:hypothetical protein
MSTNNSSSFSIPDPQIDWPIQHEVGEEQEEEEKPQLIDGPVNGSLHPNGEEEVISN